MIDAIQNKFRHLIRFDFHIKNFHVPVKLIVYVSKGYASSGTKMAQCLNFFKKLLNNQNDGYLQLSHVSYFQIFIMPAILIHFHNRFSLGKPFFMKRELLYNTDIAPRNIIFISITLSLYDLFSSIISRRSFVNYAFSCFPLFSNTVRESRNSYSKKYSSSTFLWRVTIHNCNCRTTMYGSVMFF